MQVHKKEIITLWIYMYMYEGNTIKYNKSFIKLDQGHPISVLPIM